MSLGVVMISSCKRELLSPVPQTSVSDATAFDTPARVANQVNSMYQAFKSGTFFGGRAQIAGAFMVKKFLIKTLNLFTVANVWNLIQ